MLNRIISFQFYFLLTGVILLSSCSKDDEPDNPNNNPDTPVSDGIMVSYTQDGTEKSFEISERIGIFMDYSEIDGLQAKRVEVFTGGDNEYPSISMDFPYRTGEIALGTSYGGQETDYLYLDLGSEESYGVYPDLQETIDGEYVAPWIKIDAISDNGTVSGSFGGTFIQYNSSTGPNPHITVQGSSYTLYTDDYSPKTYDLTLPIATPPSNGGGGGNTNNVVAAFEARIPGSYVSTGDDGYYGEVELTFFNKSQNATHYEWELTYSSSYDDDNYFYYENSNGYNSSFSERLRLYHVLDTNKFRVKLTAYDDNGNSDSQTQEFKFPTLKAKVYINGELLEDPGLVYYDSNPYIDDAAYRINGLLFESEVVETINFYRAGNFPSPGTFLEDIYQTGDVFCGKLNGNYTFYMSGGWGSTFDDPMGEYGSMYIDNYSVQFSNADGFGNPYEIFGKLSFDATLRKWDGSENQVNVEIFYLPPDSYYGLDKKK